MLHNLPTYQKYVYDCVKTLYKKSDMRRKYTNVPYFKHPESVAIFVRTITYADDMICAALLHDVVEDSLMTSDEIECSFGYGISKLVRELTKPSISIEYKFLSRVLRNKIDNEFYSKISKDAASIKVADIIDNVKDILSHDIEFGSLYISEKLDTLEVLKHANEHLINTALTVIKRTIKKHKNSMKSEDYDIIMTKLKVFNNV